MRTPRITATVGALAIAAALAGCGSSDAEELVIEQTSQDADAPAIQTPEQQAIAAATKAAEAYVGITDPRTAAETLDTVAAGAAKDRLNEYGQKYQDQGLAVGGAAVVVSSTVTGSDLVATPRTVNLDVCTDVSAVTVTDAAGVSQVLPTRPSRTVTTTTVSDEAGIWRVTYANSELKPC